MIAGALQAEKDWFDDELRVKVKVTNRADFG